MSAPNALAELHALLRHLPEPARNRADELLAALIRDETERTQKKSARMKRLIASHLIPAATRTSELATVVEFTLENPRLSAAKVRARLATKMPQARVREYQEILKHIKPKPADAQARARKAEQALRERIAESRSLTPHGRVREGRAPRAPDYYSGKRLWAD